MAFVFNLPVGGSKYFKICDKIGTFPSASNSVILSLAAYLTWKHPNLKHPKYPEFELEK